MRLHQDGSCPKLRMYTDEDCGRCRNRDPERGSTPDSSTNWGLTKQIVRSRLAGIQRYLKRLLRLPSVMSAIIIDHWQRENYLIYASSSGEERGSLIVVTDLTLGS